MKLVMTLLVKNEEDIIKKNLDYHLNMGVDHVIAIDNNSSDTTRDILLEYEAKGVLTLIDELGDDYSQSKWVTNAALMARDKLNADWILNNDADEFWWCKEENLKFYLQSIDADKVVCQRQHMLFPYNNNSDLLWYDHAIYRVEKPKPIVRPSDIYNGSLQEPYFYSKLPPKALIRSKGLISVSQGNHNATFSHKTKSFDSEILIYHFPVRSKNQFKQKIEQGGAAYERNTTLPPNMGWHWRRWYRLIKSKGVDAAFAEAFPSKERLNKDIGKNVVIKDESFKSLLQKLNLD